MYLVLCSSCMLHTSGTGIRPYFGVFFLGVFGMDFFSVMPGEKSFLDTFAVVSMVMGTFFRESTHASLVQIRENPEFHDLMQRG